MDLFTTITINHAEQVIEFGTLGRGPVVLLLAGQGGAGTEQFVALGNALCRAGFQAVTINPRAVGASNGDLENLTLADYVADVTVVLKEVGSPVHVVGRAFGNRLARYLAQLHSNAVKSVSLIAAGGLIPPAPGSRGSGHSPFPYHRRAGTAQANAARNTPLAQWWSGGTAPMLVLQGLEDRIAPPENGRQLAAQFPDRTRLREFANAGHGLLYEHPEEIAHEIVTFIRTVDDGTWGQT